MRSDTIERFWQKVNKTDGCWEWSAGRDRKGYGLFWTGEKMRLAHRISVELVTGQQPTQHLDHECHNPACVNPAHLREVTRKQNMENRGQRGVNNTSGHRGVSWDKANNKWQALVGHNGKQVFVGRFTNLEEAAAAVTAKRLELFTHNDADRQQQQGESWSSGTLKP